MILFRAEAGTDIGFAHLNRCLILAREFKEQGHEVFFIVGSEDHQQKNLVEKNGFHLVEIDQARLYKDEVQEYPPPPAIVITDLQQTRNIKDPARLTSYLHDLKNNGYKTVFIDALFDEAYRQADSPELDTVIQPYCGAEQDTHPNTKKWLAGAQYFILSPEISAHIAPKEIKPVAENLLVTFGGADPQGISLTVTKALLSDPRITGHVRIIAGPYFAKELTQSLKELIKEKSREDLICEIIENETAMGQQYQWADLAIGSSGLSRYEFAAMGVPAIFCAIYDNHIRQSEEYAKTDAALYLGHYARISQPDWSDAIYILMHDQKQRQNISHKEQNLISKNGAKNIVKSLI